MDHHNASFTDNEEYDSIHSKKCSSKTNVYDFDDSISATFRNGDDKKTGRWTVDEVNFIANFRTSVFRTVSPSGGLRIGKKSPIVLVTGLLFNAYIDGLRS
jgi:hypothetical protein